MIRRCRAARRRWRVSCGALTKVTAALSDCRSSRCAILPRATSMSAKAVASRRRLISSASGSACTTGSPAARSGTGISCGSSICRPRTFNGGSATSTRRARRPTFTIERDYFRRTGCFPPQHLIILRRDVWERAKWTARSLTKAFIRCNDEFAAAMRNFPYVSPWLDVELEETEALMGADFHPYGYERNRDAIDVFCWQAHELGIVDRLITAEEYFAEYLGS